MARTFAFIAVLFALLMPAVAQGQDAGSRNGRISGLMYGEYFYNIKSADSLRDVNGFQFRRIYFTYDQMLAESFDIRVRLEANEITLTAANRFGVFVKDAYLRWNDIFEGSDALFGISPTPAIEMAEKWWGYRSLERSLMDLNKVVSSRDFGVDLRGRFDDGGRYNYWVKVGNSGGSETEFDKYKRFYGAFWLEPVKNLDVLVYGQYTSKPKKTDAVDNLAKNNNVTVFDGIVHYEQDKLFSVGVEGFFQTAANNYRKTAGQPSVDQKSIGVTAYGWIALIENLRIVGRYDYVDMNTDAEGAKSDLVIAGVDFAALKNLHVMPNFYYRGFRGSSPDLMLARITLHYNF